MSAKLRKPKLVSFELGTALEKLFTQEKVPIEYFIIHDFRRICRSLSAGLKIPDHAAEQCMNYKHKGVIDTYNRYGYLDEQCEALDQLTNLMEFTIGSPSAYTSFLIVIN